MATSMSCSIYSFSGFVFVIVISPKFVVGWFWVAIGLALGICLGSGNKEGEGSSGGDAWKFVWNESNDGGSDRGGRGIKLLNAGGDSGGRGGPLLLLLSNFLLSFRNASNLFCISESMPGLGAFLISLLARFFFQYRVLEAAIQRLDFVHQSLKCLQTLARESFDVKKYFSLSNLIFV